MSASKVQVGDHVMLNTSVAGNARGKSGKVIAAEWDTPIKRWGVRVQFNDGVTLYVTEDKLALNLDDTVYEAVEIDPEDMEDGDVFVSRRYDYTDEDYKVTVRRRAPKLTLPTTLGSIIQLGTGPIEPPATYVSYNTRMVLMRTGSNGWTYIGSKGDYLSDNQVLVKAIEAGGYTLHEQVKGQKVAVKR